LDWSSVINNLAIEGDVMIKSHPFGRCHPLSVLLDCLPALQSQLCRLLPIKIPAYLDYFPLAVVVDLCLTVFNFPNLCFAFG
jgi:hypothetical protein